MSAGLLENLGRHLYNVGKGAVYTDKQIKASVSDVYGNTAKGASFNI